MDLPYTKTETFTLNGQPYNDEASALRAAVAAALGNPGLTATVLGNARTLAPLLARAAELGMGRAPDRGANTPAA